MARRSTLTVVSMSEARLNSSLLTHALPQVSIAQVRDIAADLYQLRGEVTPLAGERDSNFRLVTAERQAYMLRFINGAESPAEIDFQSAILQHLAVSDPALPVPRLVPSRSGSSTPTLWLNTGPLTLRAVTYLPGTPQGQLPRSAQIMAEVGHQLARMDRALMGLEHPGARRDLLWDISDLSRLENGVSQLADPEQRRLIARVLELRRQTRGPQLSTLRRQVIHNDLNPQNILLDRQRMLSGIIDFGDALHAPLINELATALAYQFADDDQPLVHILPFIGAYHRALPLGDDELIMLPLLIASRLALILLIAQRRATLYPQNQQYILRNVAYAWRSLMRLNTLSLQRVAEQFLTLCRERGSY